MNYDKTGKAMRPPISMIVVLVGMGLGAAAKAIITVLNGRQDVGSGIGWVIGCVIMYFLIMGLYEGRTWAARIATILLLISIVGNIVYLSSITWTWEWEIPSIVGLVLSFVILVCLYLPPSRKWYLRS